MKPKSNTYDIKGNLKEYPLFSALVVWLLATTALGAILLASLEAQLSALASPVAAYGTEQMPSHMSIICLQLTLVLLMIAAVLALFRTAYHTLVKVPSGAVEQLKTYGITTEIVTAGGSNEIIRLASMLGAMGSRCAALQRDKEFLERTVVNQSRYTTESLDLLFRASANLAAFAQGANPLRAVLEDVVETLGASGATLWLDEVVADTMAFPSIINARATPKIVMRRSLSKLMAVGGVQRFDSRNEDIPNTIAIRIGNSSGQYGILVVETGAEFFEEWRHFRLLETLGSFVTLAIGNTLRNQRARRIALMEERAAIARDLHDSLAQSLTFIKLQLAQIRASRKGVETDDDGLNESLGELRLGVDSAYRQLRELLNAFRGAISFGGLQAALENVIDELSVATQTSIELDFRLESIALSPAEELHVLQIVREALTNVVRHAGADHSRVSVSEANGEISLSVTDDGRGFAFLKTEEEAIAPDGHYGITIMRERSERLGGSFELRLAEAFAGKRAGAQVLVRFRPQSSRFAR